jgi:hypothetical protein
MDRSIAPAAKNARTLLAMPNVLASTAPRGRPAAKAYVYAAAFILLRATKVARDPFS